MKWVILFCAIVFEVGGTMTLKFTEGMTRVWPTLLMLSLYLCSLWFLSLAVARIPVGVAYAVWAGVGTLLVAAVGAVWFKEQVTLTRALSTLMIIVGVAGLYLSSPE